MARPREFEEAAVIERAMGQFWATGYAATSVEDLVASTGISRGSLYGAFRGKHHLLLRALDAYCAHNLAAIHADLDGPDPEATERLARHMRHVADSCGANRQGCFLARTTAELASRDEAIAERAERFYDDYEHALVACLGQAQRHGDVDASADLNSLAELLLITVRGMDALGQAGRDAAFMRRVAAHSLSFLRSSTTVVG